jgi:hypothetical protein
MFLPASANDWLCPAGHTRELLGSEGLRRLRCAICEGYDGDLFAEFDHGFLRAGLLGRSELAERSTPISH